MNEMENTFILNPALTSLEIVDGINERIMKAKALTSFLLGSDIAGDTSFKSVHGFIWVLDSCLEELECLFGQLDKITNI